MPKARRRRLAAYFTPPHLAHHAISAMIDAGIRPGQHRILDPASGGAALLVPLAARIAERWGNRPTSLWIAEEIGFPLHVTLVARAERAAMKSTRSVPSLVGTPVMNRPVNSAGRRHGIAIESRCAKEHSDITITAAGFYAHETNCEHVQIIAPVRESDAWLNIKWMCRTSEDRSEPPWMVTWEAFLQDGRLHVKSNPAG